MRVSRLAVLVAALISMAGAAFAQTPGPTAVPTPLPTPWAVGSPEIPVNSTTAADQKTPAVTIGADSGFVVTWTGDGQDGDGSGVFARRFDKTGAPLSGELQVNTTTTGDQSDPAIASDDFGNYVIVWASSETAGGSDVRAQRYDAAGNPAGGEFLVNTYTTGNQHAPRVAKYENGFVVVWTSSPLPAQPGQDGDEGGVYAQAFNDDGTPSGPEFLVNSTTTGDQRAPSISMNSSGYAVVWESAGQDGDSAGIFGQVYDGGGSGEFQVNTYTTGAQTSPDVAYFNDFVVTWSSEAQDGSSSGVFARAFHFSNNNPVGPEFQVNTHTAGVQTAPRVGRDFTFLPSPGFIITWQSDGQDDPTSPGASGVFAQRFNNAPFPTSSFTLARPSRRGSEYQINTYTTDSQLRPDIAYGRDGRFVIAWESLGQDGAGSGVVARRFDFPAAAALRVDESASGGLSNLNGVLEPGERVQIAPAWGNPGPAPGNPSLPLSGTASNLTGPPGPVYTIDDANADYGVIVMSPFAAANCADATGNCYELTVTGSRPAAHWDASFDEAPGSTNPIGPLSKTWGLHVGSSFPDVPQDAFYQFIENLFHHGVTAGGGCGTGLYCGEEGVLRQQMAVLLLKAVHGANFTPVPATGAVFDDVPVSSQFAPWIEELARQQITGGCVVPPPPALPSFCPVDTVNRQQMAVFLIKTLHAGYTPSGCIGLFGDVPCSNPFAPWIEDLVNSAITGGCQASPPLYCPSSMTKRKQMAVFLVKTFGLQLYGPD